MQPQWAHYAYLLAADVNAGRRGARPLARQAPRPLARLYTPLGVTTCAKVHK